MNKKIVTIVLAVILVLSLSSTALASDNDDGEYILDQTDNSADGGDYIIDQNNTVYVYKDGKYIVLKQSNTRSYGFGESSAEWFTTETSNGYTVKHKGWKEKQSSSSLYGARACSKTTCSPTKNHYTRARMTSLFGIITYKDSGKKWSTGTASAKSGYHDCHHNNAIMRSNWGGVS